MFISASRARRVILNSLLLFSGLLFECGYVQAAESSEDASFVIRKDFDILASRMDSKVESLSSRSDVIATEVLTAVTVLFAIISIIVGLIGYKIIETGKDFKKKFRIIRQQDEKARHLVFATANLAMANLPAITFTQQLPALTLENLAVIDEIFSGKNGIEFWKSISKHSAAARLAYSRALYRLATSANTRSALVEVSSEGMSPSAVELLDLSYSNYDGSRQREDFIGNILVRRCQAFRQAGEADDLREAQRIADTLTRRFHEYRSGPVRLWGPWCNALIHLQRAATQRDRNEKAQSYVDAIAALQPHCLGLLDTGGAASGYDAKTEEGNNIVYYMAKSLWSLKMTDSDRFNLELRTRSNSIGLLLKRSIRVSFDLFETSRHHQTDPYVSAVYHFCVALLAAVVLELDESPAFDYVDFSAHFTRHPVTRTTVREHALFCLSIADDVASAIPRNYASGPYIYCERNERLDSISAFQADIRWVRNALDDAAQIPLSRYYSHGAY